jgi:hypothetical protein
MIESPITIEDQSALAQQDAITLASAWGQLNCWRWPDWLPNPEPHTYIHDGRRSRLMHWLEEAVGLRMCMRYSEPWKDESEEDFNDFWRGCYEGHAPSNARYHHKIKEKVRLAMAAREAP